MEDGDVLQEIMSQLYAKGIEPPVSALSLAAVLRARYTPARLTFLMKQYAPLVPRVLCALNGPAVVVPADVLMEASRREKIMSASVEGWGVYEPPVAATSWRLLVSSGLSPDMLPAYTTLAKSQRERMMGAWERACDANGWEPCQHPKDLRALRLNSGLNF